MKPGEQQLRDEIALREASLADARREFDAGELSEAEVAAIEVRERAALERAHALLAALSDASPRRLRRRRKWLLVAGIVCLLLAAVVLLLVSLSPRQPDQSATGGLSLSNQQKVTVLLRDGEADIANGDVVGALSAYQQVLAIDPKNVPALTQTGWLDFSAGSSDTNPALVRLGITDLRKAIADAPRNPAPRLYYAIVADSTPGNQKLAKAQFEVFLRLKPSAAQLAIARPFLKQLAIVVPSSS
jgi:tetratricopeptide (TPR) repeat protein